MVRYLKTVGNKNNVEEYKEKSDIDYNTTQYTHKNPEYNNCDNKKPYTRSKPNKLNSINKINY